MFHKLVITKALTLLMFKHWNIIQLLMLTSTANDYMCMILVFKLYIQS